MKKRPKSEKHPSETYSITVTLPNGKTISYIAWQGQVRRVGAEGAGK